MEVSPSSVTISPNDQFTMTCTARAEFDGKDLPLEVLEWTRISISPSGSMSTFKLMSTEYAFATAGSPESGYHSNVTTTERETGNVIYRCRAGISSDSMAMKTSDVTVTVEGI